MTPQSENYNPDAKKDNGSCDLWKNKFLGTYSGTWKCDAPTQKDMTVTVSDAEGDNVSLVLTFSDGSQKLITKVNTKNSFKIDAQAISTERGNETVSGIGLLNTNATITFECRYMIDGIESTTCIFNGSK